MQTLLVSVAPLTYLPLSRATLVLFDCLRLPNGKYYLDSNLAVECFATGWWTLFPLGLLGIVAYVCGIPVFVGTILFRNHSGLFSDANVIRRYGGIYKLFRRNYVYWPLVAFAKKLGIAVVTLFLSRDGPLVLALLAVIIVGLGVHNLKFVRSTTPSTMFSSFV